MSRYRSGRRAPDASMPQSNWPTTVSTELPDNFGRKIRAVVEYRWGHAVTARRQDFPQALKPRLLIIADAAAEISVGPGYEGYLRNERIVFAWRWAHVADFADLTLRFLHRRVDFLAERLAGGIVTGAYVDAKRWFEVGIADRNERAVVNIGAKHIEVPVSESPFSRVEHVERFGLIRSHSGDGFHQHAPGFVGRTVALLSESCGQERDDRGQHRGDPEFTGHSLPPVASSHEGGCTSQY
jgi:hypothetical protein